MKKFGMLKIMVITLSLILILIPIYTYGAGRWEQIDGEATDIGVGADGSAWVIGSSKSKINGGNGIYRLGVMGWEQIDKDGGAIRIDVDPSGNPWVVDNNDNIFRRSGAEWEQIDGTATDIGIGADGSVWIVGTKPRFGGYGIYRWDGRNWEIVSDDGAVRIDVDPQGNPWIVNDNGNIYRRVGNRWEQLPGTATDIGIGADGSVWIVGTKPRFGGYGIYRWDGRNWEIVSDDGAVQISVDNRGTPWVVDSEDYIYVWKSFNWKSIQEYFGIIFKK
jgi:hypothetical protein